MSLLPEVSGQASSDAPYYVQDSNCWLSRPNLCLSGLSSGHKMSYLAFQRSASFGCPTGGPHLSPGLSTPIPVQVATPCQSNYQQRRVTRDVVEAKHARLGQHSLDNMNRDRLTHPVHTLNGRAVATHRAVGIQCEALAHRVDVTLVRANLGVVCVAVNLRDSTRAL